MPTETSDVAELRGGGEAGMGGEQGLDLRAVAEHDEFDIP